VHSIDLLDYQYDFLSLTCPNAALIGGVGTGKTMVLAYFILDMISKYPKTKGMIVANTYSQLLNSTLEPLFSILDELGIPYTKHISSKYIMIYKTKIYCYSLEKVDNIRGIEVGYIASDEAAYAKDKKAYDTIKTRLRCKHGPLYYRAFSTKNGYNYFYDMYASPDKSNSWPVIEAQTSDNTFLPEQYIRDLLDDYGSIDAPMYKQEVLNEYVNLTSGSVYWSFDRNIHVKPTKLDNVTHTHVGVDFNIDQMSAIYTQMRGETLHVCKEVSLTEQNANTFMLAERMSKDLFDYPYRSIIPDSTGKARKTSSQKSDHQILRDAGFRLDVTTNPPIRDRQNSVNRMFNLHNIVIDPSCTNLIKELETLSARDKEGDTVHISVALGYIINKLSPVIRKPKSTMIQR